jgi:NET1-associated nuclear protein 1 (U3 small nucleolar RNA-associated protein 17)
VCTHSPLGRVQGPASMVERWTVSFAVPCSSTLSDGRFYFSVSQNLVHVHSATPPGYDLLSTIGRGPDGHTRNITALQRHPTNPMQILTASNDGTVKVWDWVEGRLVRTLILTTTGKCLHMAVGRVTAKWHVFVTAGVPKENHDPKKPGESRRLYDSPHTAYGQALATISTSESSASCSTPLPKRTSKSRPSENFRPTPPPCLSRPTRPTSSLWPVQRHTPTASPRPQPTTPGSPNASSLSLTKSSLAELLPLNE